MAPSQGTPPWHPTMATSNGTQQCQHRQMAPNNQKNYKPNSNSAQYHGTTPGTSSQQPTIAPNHPTNWQSNGTSKWHQTKQPMALLATATHRQWHPPLHPQMGPNMPPRTHLCFLLKYTPPPTPEIVVFSQIKPTSGCEFVYVKVAGFLQRKCTSQQPPTVLVFSEVKCVLGSMCGCDFICDAANPVRIAEIKCVLVHK